ncbi:hypothetical protein LguiA_034432 [Lonicera macranthoides]
MSPVESLLTEMRRVHGKRYWPSNTHNSASQIPRANSINRSINIRPQRIRPETLR